MCDPVALDPSAEGVAIQLSRVSTPRAREERNEARAMLRLRRPVVLAFRTLGAPPTGTAAAGWAHAPSVLTRRHDLVPAAFNGI